LDFESFVIFLVITWPQSHVIIKMYVTQQSVKMILRHHISNIRIFCLGFSIYSK